MLQHLGRGLCRTLAWQIPPCTSHSCVSLSAASPHYERCLSEVHDGQEQPQHIATGCHDTGYGMCRQHASCCHLAGGQVRSSPAHPPLCGYPELTMHRHACSSTHHDAVQQGDVRHVHRPQLVIQGILGSEEAAGHHTNVNIRASPCTCSFFRQRLVCMDADRQDAAVRQARLGMEDDLGILTRLSLTSWPQHCVLSGCLHPALLPSRQCPWKPVCFLKWL